MVCSSIFICRGHVAVRSLDGLWLHGGCAAETVTFSDSFTLSLAQGITSDNAVASGPGLIGGVPDSNTSFKVQLLVGNLALLSVLD